MDSTVYTVTNWELPQIPKGCEFIYDVNEQCYKLPMNNNDIVLTISANFINEHQPLFISQEKFAEFEQTQNLLLLAHYIPLLYRHCLVINHEHKTVTLLTSDGELLSTDHTYIDVPTLYSFIVNYYMDYTAKFITWSQVVPNVPFSLYYLNHEEEEELVEGSPFTVLQNLTQVMVSGSAVHVYSTDTLTVDKEYAMQYDINFVINKFKLR